MEGQIGWDLFWNASGRLGRTGFWVAAAIVISIASIYESWVPPALHWLTGWFIYPGLLWAGACVLSKRLHDRGRSGWWAALILFALVAVWPHPRGFGSFVFSLILIWAAIELGVMQSEAAPTASAPAR